MKKILFYRMTYDTGFAPNPYGDYLTLATCTPNHIRASLKVGDWIVGVESKKLAQKRKSSGCCKEVSQCLIYIAKVTEILDLNSYFRDPRFEYKKYSHSKNSGERKNGDNIYYLEKGIWKWIRRHPHEPKHLWKKKDEEIFFHKEDFIKLWKNKRQEYGAILQDIRGNRVFISKEFLYFGDKCLELSKEFLELIPIRGIKYCSDSNSKESFNKFMKYSEFLIQKFGFGKHGSPINYCIKNTTKRESCG